MKRTGALIVCLALLCSSSSGRLAAQSTSDQAAAQPRSDLFVQVIDGASERVIPSARVRLLEADQAALTDADGRHLFANLVAGEYYLSVEQYGFSPVALILQVAPGKGEVQIALQPQALEIEGIEVVAERIAAFERQLRRRRNAAPVATRVYEQERLLHSAAFDMVEFLEADPAVRIADCGAYYCVLRRGRLLEPKIFIDEVPIYRGLDQLRFYQPSELHMVEVFAGGTEVRAYTKRFMERMVKRPMALLPLGD